MNSKTGYINSSEEILLQGLKSGNEESLKQVYRNYYKPVQHMVISNNGNDDDARDVYQDTVCVLYDAVRKPEFSLTCSLGTYIYSIARNLWLKELRSRNQGELRLHENADFPEVDTEESLEIFYRNEKRIEVINQSMADLGEPCNNVLRDFFYFKLSMEEIAGKYGYTNAENAKNQKYKCFVRLKKLLMINSREK